MSDSEQPKEKQSRKQGDREVVPLERWSVERPHDSSEYLRRRGPWPKWKPRD